MGLWSSNPENSPRESVLHQKDEDGNVSTDTLSLVKPAQRFQVRLTFNGTPKPKIKYLGVCVTRHETETRSAGAEPQGVGKNFARPGTFPDELPKRQCHLQSDDCFDASQFLGARLKQTGARPGRSRGR